MQKQKPETKQNKQGRTDAIVSIKSTSSKEKKKKKSQRQNTHDATICWIELGGGQTCQTVINPKEKK